MANAGLSSAWILRSGYRIEWIGWIGRIQWIEWIRRIGRIKRIGWIGRIKRMEWIRWITEIVPAATGRAHQVARPGRRRARPSLSASRAVPVLSARNGPALIHRLHTTPGWTGPPCAGPRFGSTGRKQTTSGGVGDDNGPSRRTFTGARQQH